MDGEYDPHYPDYGDAIVIRNGKEELIRLHDTAEPSAVDLSGIGALLDSIDSMGAIAPSPVTPPPPPPLIFEIVQRTVPENHRFFEISVTNIPSSIHDNGICEFISQYGQNGGVRIYREGYRTTATVAYYVPEDADQVVRRMDRENCYGRNLRVRRCG